MNHDRAMSVPISPFVGAVKTLRQRKVELDGSTLPRPIHTVADMKVDLRTIECTIAGIQFVLYPRGFQRPLQLGLGVFPHLVCTDGFPGASA